MWKAILIDDEEIALDVLDIQLAEIGGVTVAGKFQLVSEALEQCARLRPDLIFLDIEMPGISGLAAAELLFDRCPDAEIIYVTAHHQYAIDAFDTNAIGYLLKPVAKERLIKALSRFADLQEKKAKPNDAAPVMEGKTGEGGEAALSLKVLGSMELYATDGRLMTWRTKKTKELFALLWHYQGQPVYRYGIQEELWPDYPADRSQRLLHTSLYYLRVMFKSEGYPDIVMHGDERYWINKSVIQSDIDRLSDKLETGLAGEELLETLQLYDGDYFETEHYPWANARRMELRGKWISCMTQALDKAPDDVRSAILRRLIRLEPNREEYYDRLADILNRTGDPAGARQAITMKERILSD
ncbi:response regulator [Paenibacillus ginsengarvi]|uniref:Response regulator n=1 Tax=Paenibacillus ginsengarvi TaxID=400777 RepID=A0A3B0CK71_9BACL|nr:response regulator [Paenibacillus ginsengarvi]RKN85612.1 response regulator [Paenibacillus ginsengarvi]